MELASSITTSFISVLWYFCLIEEFALSCRMIWIQSENRLCASLASRSAGIPADRLSNTVARAEQGAALADQKTNNDDQIDDSEHNNNVKANVPQRKTDY